MRPYDNRRLAAAPEAAATLLSSRMRDRFPSSRADSPVKTDFPHNIKALTTDVFLWAKRRRRKFDGKGVRRYSLSSW
jgi:hypothetical protein